MTAAELVVVMSNGTANTKSTMEANAARLLNLPDVVGLRMPLVDVGAILPKAVFS